MTVSAPPSAAMIDPMNPHGLFHLASTFVWVQCDLPEHRDFWCEVRMNLRNSERKVLAQQVDGLRTQRRTIADQTRAAMGKLVDQQQKAVANQDESAAAKIAEKLVQLADEANAAYDENDNQMQALIAPFVKTWNAAIETADGELVRAPSPMDIGVSAFEAIDKISIEWITNALLSSYRSGNGLTSSPTSSGDELAPTNEPPSESETDSQT